MDHGFTTKRPYWISWSYTPFITSDIFGEAADPMQKTDDMLWMEAPQYALPHFFLYINKEWAGESMYQVVKCLVKWYLLIY